MIHIYERTSIKGSVTENSKHNADCLPTLASRQAVQAEFRFIRVEAGGRSWEIGGIAKTLTSTQRL